MNPMSIGTQPVTAGVPSTTVHFGAGHPGKRFVAELTNTDALNPPPRLGAGEVPDRRLGVPDWRRRRSWTDVATVGTSATAAHGGDAATPAEVRLETASTRRSTPRTTACYPAAPGAPTDQCLLVELSQANGSGMRFVHDSARRNMDFVNASTFERSAEDQLEGAGAAGGQPRHARRLRLRADVAPAGGHRRKSSGTRSAAGPPVPVGTASGSRPPRPRPTRVRRATG